MNARSKPKGSQSYSEAAKRQFADVRERLIARRQELGISMSELARGIGVSPSLISQIERGQSLPSVETLFALAAALGATVDTFFESAPEVDANSPQPRSGRGRQPARKVPAPARAADMSAAGHRYVVRDGQRASIDIRGGVRWERLTPDELPGMDFLELIYQPGAKSDEHLYRHPGFEMVVVLKGAFEIDIGFERYALEPGDSMAFPSSLPHRYVNSLAEESRAVTMILRDPTVVPEEVVESNMLDEQRAPAIRRARKQSAKRSSSPKLKT